MECGVLLRCARLGIEGVMPVKITFNRKERLRMSNLNHQAARFLIMKFLEPPPDRSCRSFKI
jgi:hypothetical protein